MQVQLQRPQGGAGRVLQRRRLPRHLGSVESETQRWAGEERRQDPAHRQPCGYYFLNTYEVSDSGMSALPPTLAQSPPLQSHFPNKEGGSLTPAVSQYRAREACLTPVPMPFYTATLGSRMST